MFDLIKAESNLTMTLEDFEREILEVYNHSVLPKWDVPSPTWWNRLPRILYGSMMWCFARIDLMSGYWKGDLSPNNQTKRMVDFVETYLGRGRLEAAVAIQMWRHKLMHTSEPRPLLDPMDNKKYRWLLHWGDKIQPQQHFTFTTAADNDVILNISLMQLIADLKRGTESYLRDVKSNSDLRIKFEKIENELSSYKLKRY